ncbi:MAG: XdhC/CoxI family protein [Thermoplasmata archaeon]|nr:XdhC/CoxI family protein [Thermoplasmata archaeon]
MDRHEPFVRATVVKAVGSVPGKVGAAMILRPDGTFLGTIGGAGLEEQVKDHVRAALASRKGDLYHFDLQAWKPGGLPSLCGGSVDIAVEYVPARPNLLLWGGGHVAEAIAHFLPRLEYDYSVADDRPEWVTAERFPEADRREAVTPSEVWAVFDPAEFSHLYLLGYDAKKDLELLALSLDRFPGYIGLISSAPKRAHMFADLRRRGVSAAKLGRVHAPIGLPIGAESPAEIAISVVAEIVRSMRGPVPRRGASHRTSNVTRELST